MGIPLGERGVSPGSHPPPPPPYPGRRALGLSLAVSLTPSSGNIYVYYFRSSQNLGVLLSTLRLAAHPLLSTSSSALSVSMGTNRKCCISCSFFSVL